MRTIIIYISIACLILGLGWFGVRQYGNARVEQTKTEIVTEAVSEAVQKRDQRIKADAQAEAGTRQKLAPVARAVQNVRNHKNDEVHPDRSDDAEWRRLFNDAIAEGNRAIDSTIVVH